MHHARTYRGRARVGASSCTLLRNDHRARFHCICEVSVVEDRIEEAVTGIISQEHEHWEDVYTATKLG